MRKLLVTALALYSLSARYAPQPTIPSTTALPPHLATRDRGGRGGSGLACGGLRACRGASEWICRDTSSRARSIARGRMVVVSEGVWTKDGRGGRLRETAAFVVGLVPAEPASRRAMSGSGTAQWPMPIVISRGCVSCVVHVYSLAATNCEMARQSITFKEQRCLGDQCLHSSPWRAPRIITLTVTTPATPSFRTMIVHPRFDSLPPRGWTR